MNAGLPLLWCGIPSSAVLLAVQTVVPGSVLPLAAVRADE